jgi:hypothetical protein
VSAPPGFRRAWLSWFVCPKCGYRSLFPRLAGRVGRDGKSFRVLYWCAACSGLSERKRQWLAPALAFASSVPAFVLIYYGLLDGFSISAALWVVGVVAGMHALNLAIERFTNEYVAADNNEP